MTVNYRSGEIAKAAVSYSQLVTAMNDGGRLDLSIDWVSVCCRYAAGESFKDIAEDYVVEQQDLRVWMTMDPIRAAAWREATFHRAFALSDEMIDVARSLKGREVEVEEVFYNSETGEPTVRRIKRWVVPNAPEIQAAKLMIDVLRWHASKLAPRVFGDKLEEGLKERMTHEDALKQIMDMTDEP